MIVILFVRVLSIVNTGHPSYRQSYLSMILLILILLFDGRYGAEFGILRDHALTMRSLRTASQEGCARAITRG